MAYCEVMHFAIKLRTPHVPAERPNLVAPRGQLGHDSAQAAVVMHRERLLVGVGHGGADGWGRQGRFVSRNGRRVRDKNARPLGIVASGITITDGVFGFHDVT